METKGMTGAETFLRVLASMGVERIFASPGSEWAPVWEFLAKPYESPNDIPQYLSSRHEEIAVGMASGYAKASGKLSAVMIHTTVGALHATMAMRAAVHEQVPMVVFAGESIAFGENGDDLGHQWLRLLADVGGPARLVETSVKWSFGLNTSALLPTTVQRACQLAMAAPQGPVFVSLPMEFLIETMGTDPTTVASYARAATADPAAIDELARVLVEAKTPVIITEEIGRSVRAVEHLVALAELLGAPVVEGWHPASVNFPRTHPLYGGVGPTPFVTNFLKEADVAFLAAAVAPWHPASCAPGPGTKVVVLSDNPVRPQVASSGYRSDLVVAGEMEPSLALLVERVRGLIKPGSRAAQTERWRGRHQQWRAMLRDEVQASAARKLVTTRRVVGELNELLPADAVIVDETITHRMEINRFLDRLSPGRYFSGAYGGLGTGLGTALGVKAAAPDRTVINLIGDGSFNYNPVLAGLGVCQEHAMPILIVLFNNAGYLSQKSGIPHHYPEGYAVKSNTFVGTSITPSPDYAAIARAFGGYGEKVDDPGQVRPALQRGLQAVAKGQVALLDMTLEPINYSGEK
jgi:acetolactate synthase-1/2/3 large subunit